MSIEKANSNSTTTGKERIAPEDEISEFSFWSEDVNGTPTFWDTHSQCKRCDAISSLGPEDIRHKTDCPLHNATSEVQA